MIRVQVSRLVEGTLRLGGPDHHYLTRVRRVRVGETLELFDGSGGGASALITAIDASSTVLEVTQVRREEPASSHLTSIIPLLKGERMDQCVEKLVEVGCDRLILWEASRAVVRLEPSRIAARLERIRAQVAAAVRQCGRTDLPEVLGIWTLDEVIAQTTAQRRLLLTPGAPRLAAGSRSRSETGSGSGTGSGTGSGSGSGTETGSGSGSGSGPETGSGSGTGSGPETGSGSTLVRSAVVMLSGPEGGLSPEELHRLDAAGFERASLTNTVLRAETAPVIAIAIWRWSENL